MIFDDTQSLQLSLFDSGTENRSREVITNERTSVANVSRCPKKQMREEQYKNDAENLFRIYSKKDKNITISLQELLKICSRKRHRKDAYVGLQGYLKTKFGIELLIM